MLLNAVEAITKLSIPSSFEVIARVGAFEARFAEEVGLCCGMNILIVRI